MPRAAAFCSVLLFIADIGVVGAGDHRDEAAKTAPAADHEAVQKAQHQKGQCPVHAERLVHHMGDQAADDTAGFHHVSEVEKVVHRFADGCSLADFGAQHQGGQRRQQHGKHHRRKHTRADGTVPAGKQHDRRDGESRGRKIEAPAKQASQPGGEKVYKTAFGVEVADRRADRQDQKDDPADDVAAVGRAGFGQALGRVALRRRGRSRFRCGFFGFCRGFFACRCFSCHEFFPVLWVLPVIRMYCCIVSPPPAGRQNKSLFGSYL